MSCDKPSFRSKRKHSRRDEARWYHWILFFVCLAGYGAMMGLMLYFVNGGFGRG